MSKVFGQRPLQQRSILIGYLGTVAAAAIAVAAAHFTDAAASTTERDSRVLLDLVREQQGLAQRIATLAARSTEGDQALEFQRRQLTHRFARTHEALRQADPALGLGTSSALEFRTLYAEGDHPLATDVQGFLGRLQGAEGGPPANRTGGEAQALAAFADETFPNRLDTLARIYIRASNARADTLETMSGVLSAVALVALVVQGLAVAWPLWRRFGHYDRALTAIGFTDPATGALTAQSFAVRAAGEIQRARRYRRPVSVMTIATTFAAGTIDSDALRTLYGRLSETLRPSDFVGLLEGGVFAAILPETDLYAAELACHRILREFDTHPIAVDGQIAKVGVWIGMAQVRPDEGSPDEPLGRAMAALRAARSAGGDRVAVSPMREPRSPQG